MAGTISFGGIGSGMDTEGIVTGLVQASRGTADALKTRAKEADTAVSTLSNISSLLSTFKKSVDALATVREVGSYKASSSSTAIAISANGTALPSTYKVNVTALAKEQRNYTSTYASNAAALGQSGTLDIQVGAAVAKSVTIDADDTLDEVANKINASGARVSASTFYDGSTYRLQIRGLDTGAANAVTYGQNGVDFGLNLPASRYQQATNAAVTIDDIPVSSATNQIVGAIQGVTLALTEETTAAIAVKVEQDPKGLETKLKSVVDSYNAIVSKIHETAGFGTVKGTSPVLSGDSALRSINARMSNAILSSVTGAGTHDSLADLGVSLARDGKLSLDATKLSNALTADPSSVAAVLAGPGTSDGAMDVLSDLVEGFTQSSNGALALRKDALEKRSKSLKTQMDREEDRLARYGDSLRKQFTSMDTTVAGYNSQYSYLSNFFR